MLVVRKASCWVANPFSIRLKLIWPRSSLKTTKMSKQRIFLLKAPGVNGLNISFTGGRVFRTICVVKDDFVGREVKQIWGSWQEVWLHRLSNVCSSKSNTLNPRCRKALVIELVPVFPIPGQWKLLKIKKWQLCRCHVSLPVRLFLSCDLVPVFPYPAQMIFIAKGRKVTAFLMWYEFASRC